MTWSTEEEAAEELASNPNLLSRIEELCEAEVEERMAGMDVKEHTDRRLKSLLRLIREKAESYSAIGIQQKVNFLNDELGSAVRRWPGRPANEDDDDDGYEEVDERNVRFEVFFYFYEGIAFTVFWPTKRIEADEEVLR